MKKKWVSNFVGRRALRMAPLFLAGMSLVSCVTTGRDFPSQTDWIRKESTSQKDVQMLLGKPFAIGNSGGVPTWTYGYYRYQLVGKSYHKELKFYWAPNQVVRHFNFTSSFPGDLPGTEEPENTGESPKPLDSSKNQGDAKKPFSRY